MSDFYDNAISVFAHRSFMKDFAVPGMVITDMYPWFYNAVLGSATDQITTANPVSVNIQTQADSVFICTSLSASALTSAGTLASFSSLLFQITDTSTGKAFFNTPLSMFTTTGLGGVPRLLPSPRILNPNANIRVDASVIQETPPVAARIFNGFWLTLGGLRVFYEETPK